MPGSGFEPLPLICVTENSLSVLKLFQYAPCGDVAEGEGWSSPHKIGVIPLFFKRLRGGRANRQPRAQCRSPDLFGGCGPNPVHAKNKGEGFAPLAARPRRSKAHFASPSDYRGYASMPAPPLPTHLLRIRMGALKKAHRAVQFAPFPLVPLLLTRKPLALLRALPSCVTAAGCLRKRASLARGGRSRLHPRIPLLFGKRERGAGNACSPFPLAEGEGFEPPEAFTSIGGRRGIRTPGGFHLNGFQDRRDRPLRHPSVSAASKGSRFLLFWAPSRPFLGGAPAFRVCSQAAPGFRSPLLGGAPHSNPSQPAPRRRPAFKPVPSLNDVRRGRRAPKCLRPSAYR